MTFFLVFVHPLTAVLSHIRLPLLRNVSHLSLPCYKDRGIAISILNCRSFTSFFSSTVGRTNQSRPRSYWPRVILSHGLDFHLDEQDDTIKVGPAFSMFRWGKVGQCGTQSFSTDELAPCCIPEHIQHKREGLDEQESRRLL